MTKLQEQPGWEPKPGDAIAVKYQMEPDEEPSTWDEDEIGELAPWRSAEEIAAMDDVIVALADVDLDCIWGMGINQCDPVDMCCNCVTRAALARLEEIRSAD